MRHAGRLLHTLREMVPAELDGARMTAGQPPATRVKPFTEAVAAISCPEISIRFDLRAKRWVRLAIVPV